MRFVAITAIVLTSTPFAVMAAAAATLLAGVARRSPGAR